uniref:DUF7789 domain-containing protein n=1 Tax=Hucho hucho TaxID=62062 RepID=A0A4W5L364_9TELE
MSCAPTLLIQRLNMMAFRVGGALETMQEQYLLLNLCFSMVTFYLQAQVLKEPKQLVWVFILQNVPEVAYFLYLMYRISTHWGQDKTYTLEATAVTGAVISVLIKGVLFWALFRLARSSSQGLERMLTDKQ